MYITFIIITQQTSPHESKKPVAPVHPDHCRRCKTKRDLLHCTGVTRGIQCLVTYCVKCAGLEVCESRNKLSVVYMHTEDVSILYKYLYSISIFVSCSFSFHMIFHSLCPAMYWNGSASFVGMYVESVWKDRCPMVNISSAEMELLGVMFHSI